MRRSSIKLAGRWRAALIGVTLALPQGMAQAYTEVRTWIQAAARNREASTFTQFSCNSAGENGRIYYLYQYTNRPPGMPLYRLVIPPDWGRSIGGRDWSDRNLVIEAIARGCHSR